MEYQATLLVEIDREDSFDFLSSEYCDLFYRSTATGFQHPLWISSLYRRLTEKRVKPAVIVCRSKPDRRLLFVIPMVSTRFIGFSFIDVVDSEVSDYNTVVIDRDFATMLSKNQDVKDRVREMVGRLAVMRMCKVRGDMLTDAGVLSPVCETLTNFSAHQMCIDGPLYGWRSRLYSPHFDRYVKSKTKRLAKKGRIHIQELRDVGRIREAFELMRSFRRRRLKTDILNDRDYFEFYVGAAANGYVSGLSRTYVLLVGSKRVAVLFGLAHDRKFMFLLMGFTLEEFKNHSVGLILLDQVIEDCIDKGDRIFDLTIGDEIYKREFASDVIPIVTIWGGNRCLAWVGHIVTTQAFNWRRIRQRLQPLIRKRKS